MNEAQVSVGHRGRGVDDLQGTEAQDTTSGLCRAGAQGVLPLSVKGHSHGSGQESAWGGWLQERGRPQPGWTRQLPLAPSFKTSSEARKAISPAPLSC